ncbi:hypothetical protein BLNAU_15528 [Blattamonas nauphoetae]|uniref:PHD-type domain-containing protein n=1 Tax=Blattamonas nauphoetae TaxID=2049346 RepID=A0ABQ9XC87_9EUKA|nr:hypothetical protein BLNAU_15528 [Blattamonas nauphoetae]
MSGSADPGKSQINFDLLDDEVPEDQQNCTICGQPMIEEENPVVLCDGCSTAVHAFCYAISSEDLEKDTWLCKPCSLEVPPRNGDTPNEQRRCSLCTHVGGAMSLTTKNTFVHTSCVLYSQKAFFRDRRADISKMDINKHVFTHITAPENKKCCLCKSPDGCFTQCVYPGCMNKLHIHCTVRARLHLSLLPTPTTSLDFPQTFTCIFCPTHWTEMNQDGTWRMIGRKGRMSVFRERQATEEEKIQRKYVDTQSPDDSDAEKEEKVIPIVNLSNLYPGSLPVEDVGPLRDLALSSTTRRTLQYKDYPSGRKALSECLFGRAFPPSKKAKGELRQSSIDQYFLNPDTVLKDLGMDESDDEKPKHRRHTKTKVLDDDDPSFEGHSANSDDDQKLEQLDADEDESEEWGDALSPPTHTPLKQKHQHHHKPSASEIAASSMGIKPRVRQNPLWKDNANLVSNVFGSFGSGSGHPSSQAQPSGLPASQATNSNTALPFNSTASRYPTLIPM